MTLYISKAIHTVYWRSTVVFPAFEREPGSTDSHPHRPETHTERRAFVGHQLLKTWCPSGQSHTPAPGFSLPSQWRSSSCGPPTASDRPGWSWEATNTDCCTWDGRSIGQKKKKKIHQRNDKHSIRHSFPEQGPHLSSCGIIAPLDVELWRGRRHGQSN